ncbi:hypothetical protein A2V82_02365 [candidate division KSB1 bacterium RBG_16_48_16]|nr:MAG: hypothetical protein A2V82_02365 [candidate division KSB1 bacterium RBG_16_48_16]
MALADDWKDNTTSPAVAQQGLAHGADGNRDRRADSWKKYYDQGCAALTANDLQQARTLFNLAINVDYNQPLTWIKTAMMFQRQGDMSSAIAAIQTSLDLDPENTIARYYAGIFNRVMLERFADKTGKKLSCYQEEIVYTTEDELLVKRGDKIDDVNFARALDAFWTGFVGGDWNAVRTRHEFSEEQMKQYIDHIARMLAMEFFGVKIQKNDRILDIGTGAGKILHVLAQHGLLKNVTATDVAVNELRGLKRKFYKAHHDQPLGYVGLLAQQLPFKKQVFDVILMMDIVEHLYHNELVAVLKEIKNILKPGGRIYIQTPNGMRYMGKLERLPDNKINIPEMNGNWQHVAEKSMGYLKKTLNDCGYDVEVLNRLRCAVKATVA